MIEHELFQQTIILHWSEFSHLIPMLGYAMKVQHCRFVFPLEISSDTILVCNVILNGARIIILSGSDIGC